MYRRNFEWIFYFYYFLAKCLYCFRHRSVFYFENYVFLFANFEIFDFIGWEGGKAKFRKIRVFERNSAPNYSIVKKGQMKRLDLNTKKSISAIFEFSILRGEIAKFRKIRIFKFGFSAVNCCKKWGTLNSKIIFSAVLKFSI